MSITLNGSGTEARTVTPQGFRIRRANATVTGFQPSIDPVVTDRLKELDALLLKPVVPVGQLKQLRAWVELPLTPRRSGSTDKPTVGKWANGSLADKLRDQQAGAGERTLGDIIDGEDDLAELRYSFEDGLDDRWNELDFNQKAVLGYIGVRHLLVIRAHLVYGISQPASVMNFVLNHARGVAEVVRYAAISAARDYIQDKQLRVKGIDDDDSDAVKALESSVTSLSGDSFDGSVIEVVTDFTDSSKYEGLIISSGVKDIPAEVRPRLIEYIKTSAVTVTEANAPFMIPMYLAKAATTRVSTSGASSDDPFAVDFFVEDSTQLQVSTAAVKCASQLYYVMVLGDELGVFDAVRYFTHRYLFREGFAVEDPVLRRDLENYVFSEQFPGLDDQSGEQRMMRCTRAGERRSFYRQVFDQGKEPVPGDGMPNPDFGRHWKILMLESARYLERAQASPHPDNYVSRQNVMQAVEDLQYNLSSTCVGMATVMTPLMYAELDFVVKRILGHQEVRKHLVPSGGSWWKVVEKLQAGQGHRARASVLHNKARIGYALIRDIANYSPSQFEQDDPFAEFISNVDAFITTQSILQEEVPGSSDSGTTDGPVDPDSDSDSDSGSGWGSGRGSGSSRGGGYGSGTLPGMPDLSKLPGMPAIPGVSAPWPGSNGGTNGSTGNGSSMAPPDGAGKATSDEWDF